MSSNIKLRELVSHDKFVISTLLNNKKIWDNLRDYIPFPYAVEDADEFIEFTKTKKPIQNFGIDYNGEICGVISIIVQEDIYQKTAEIGYWIGEEYWGNGIGTESIKLITEYGFQKLNIERIHAGIFAYNKASMTILEKNGYKKEGVFKKAIFKNGLFFDEHRYAIIKSK
ncbi:MAG: GNAT family N-acetyltransferase [Flavobacteriales bacterium]|nr:MAG: GNAT family N-acetyltransferase [Flavobacteriales bacterium]